MTTHGLPGDRDISLKKQPSKAGIETDQQNPRLASAEGSLAESPPTESEGAESGDGNGSHDPDQPVASIPDSTKPISRTISPRKFAANRRNAQRSTGPKTARGKAISFWNSLRHGLLSKRLMQFNDQKAEEFYHLLDSLRRDTGPVGALEEMLVEKIAYEYFRTATAAQYEKAESILDYLGEDVVRNLVRYQTMSNRQFYQAINQLERSQRLRRGEDVPAPLNVQVSHEISDEKRTGD